LLIGRRYCSHREIDLYWKIHSPPEGGMRDIHRCHLEYDKNFIRKRQKRKYERKRKKEDYRHTKGKTDVKRVLKNNAEGA
jgi:hypothetical protein